MMLTGAFDQGLRGRKTRQAGVNPQVETDANDNFTIC